MSEFDADLKRLFAQSREDFDGAAFRADVEQRIARARKAQYLTDAAFVIALAAVAVIGTPAVMDIIGTLTTDVVDPGLALSATPIGAWATAAVASTVALVWARV